MFCVAFSLLLVEGDDDAFILPRRKVAFFCSSSLVAFVEKEGGGVVGVEAVVLEDSSCLPFLSLFDTSAIGHAKV